MKQDQSSPFETEVTPQGQPTLVSGVPPITERERIEAMMNGPIRPRRPQKPLNIGLFDEDARRQMDLL